MPSSGRPSVLFVGIGAMGQPMARRLADAGFELTVNDADRAKAVAVAEALGARAVSPEEWPQQADRFNVVILMLPDTPAVEAVLVGECGLLRHLAPGSVVVDMSSSAPSGTVRLAAEAAERRIGYLDAPVSGGVPRAITGDLAIMVGGEAALVESHRSLLEAMGSAVTHVGGPGAGHAMKALNNLLSAIGMVAASEVLSIGTRFGIEPRTALDVINGATGRNQATEVKFGRYVLSRRFDSGFAMQLMVKDLRTALELAHDAGVAAPISASALEEWTAAIAARGRQADHTEISAYVESRAGVELAESAPADGEQFVSAHREMM